MSRNNKDIFDLIVVGAGAAGLAAVSTKILLNYKLQKKEKVLIIEKNNTLGKSLLKTGNGRCNLSNELLFENRSMNLYNNEEFVKNVLHSCNHKFKNNFKISDNNICAVKQLFHNLGLITRTDKNKRIYPYTNSSKTIVEIFTRFVHDNNIECMLNSKLISIKEIQNNIIQIVCDNGTKFYTKKLLVTTGKVLDKILFFENSYTNIYPALCPICTEKKILVGLDGIKIQAKCKLYNKSDNLIHEEFGEVLFRKYGLSGICIFNISRFIKNKKNMYVVVDMTPDWKYKDLLTYLRNRYTLLQTYKDSIDIKLLLCGILQNNISLALSKILNFEWKNISWKNLKKIATIIKNFKLNINGVNSSVNSQVYQGGVDTSFLNSNSLRYRHSNIYLAGEIVDIDGPCGGYNLHWAWMSGILASLP